jgi:hypothetical protein
MRFLKNPHDPHALGKPFKVTAPSCTTVGYLQTNCQRYTLLCQRPFIHYIQLLATTLGAHLESVDNGAEKFFELEFCFSL